ncbi:MAG: hypothetical protein ACJAW8_000429 [Oleispira sp.]|jgi:hypothetical protein
MLKLELDHFFILVEPGAKVANLLVELGLEESFSRDHPGQGTSNLCFSFSNSKLELLWLRDEDEVNNGPAKGLKFPDRYSNREASPFGLIFNRKASIDNTSDLAMPFDGWRYQPEYFPAPRAFHVGINSDNLIEPLCIYMPFMEPVKREVDLTREKGQFSAISNVHIHVPVELLSQELAIASQAEGLTVERGAEHLMEVTFTRASNDTSKSNTCVSSKDLRPDLPLILHW